jgi:hypothetical protein
VSGRVARRQQSRWADQEADASAQQAEMPAAPPAGGGDVAAQIQQLATLKDQGLLTDEEFAAKKKQILGI